MSKIVIKESFEIRWKSTSSSGVNGFAGSAGASFASFAPFDFAFGSAFALGSALASAALGSAAFASFASDFGVAGAAGDGTFDDLPDPDFFFYISKQKHTSNRN